MGLVRGIRRSFWRGLATLLPALLTFVVLSLGLDLLNQYAGRHVNWLIIHAVHWTSGVPLEEVEAWYAAYWLYWLGIVGAVILLCLVAYIVGTFLGGSLVRLMESYAVRLPILRKIYPGAKQVSEFFFSEGKVEFRRVVAVEFPRKGLWMVGFVTGRGLQGLCKRTGTELLSVFIPFTPAPVTGYVVMVARDDAIELQISVDEAFQYIISAGVILPPAERVASLSDALQVTREEARAMAESAGGSTSNNEPRP
jgi:uncharacterized membrane protein